VCIVNAPPTLLADTWTALLPVLQSAIEEVMRHGRAYVAVHDAGLQDAFVQFGVTAEGWVVAEASGTVAGRSCCQGRHEVTRDQQTRLASLGWRRLSSERAASTPSKLWERPLDERWHSPAPLYSELFVRTLVEVFGVASAQHLRWRFGNMPREGGVERAA